MCRASAAGPYAPRVAEPREMPPAAPTHPLAGAERSSGVFRGSKSTEPPSGAPRQPGQRARETPCFLRRLGWVIPEAGPYP
jgi:hypothetical protein